MEYFFLNDDFYNTYKQDTYPQIQQKRFRPYIMVKVSIDEREFGIPLRSGIGHAFAYWTNKSANCGADYSKAILLIDSKYKDQSNAPRVRDDEHNKLKGKDYIIARGFEKYVDKYMDSLLKLELHSKGLITCSEKQLSRYKKICNFSTLQYFHKELNINSTIQEQVEAEEQAAATKDNK